MKWSLVAKNINELKPQAKNPRRLSKEQKSNLFTSLENFGMAEPIVVNTDGTIIGGHQRYLMLKSKGQKLIDCMMPDTPLSPMEIDELTIRLNKNQGEFDYDLLANSYDPENLVEWGFTMDELHLESLPDQKDQPKTFQLTAKFENEDDLRQAEIDIASIIDKYASASYKVKVK